MQRGTLSKKDSLLGWLLHAQTQTLVRVQTDETASTDTVYIPLKVEIQFRMNVMREAEPGALLRRICHREIHTPCPGTDAIIVSEARLLTCAKRRPAGSCTKGSSAKATRPCHKHITFMTSAEACSLRTAIAATPTTSKGMVALCAVRLVGLCPQHPQQLTLPLQTHQLTMPELVAVEGTLRRSVLQAWKAQLAAAAAASRHRPCP